MNRYDDLQRRTEALLLLSEVTRKSMFLTQQATDSQILTIDHKPPISLNVGDTIMITATYKFDHD